MVKDTVDQNKDKTLYKRRAQDDGIYLVVADETEEFDLALRHAARRAEVTRSNVGILYVMDMDNFQHWKNVEDMMKDELRDHAEKFLWSVAKTVNDLNGLLPVYFMAEGNVKDQVIQCIDDNPAIRALVLAGQPGSSNPGALVSYFTGKGLSKLRAPLILVPGHLETTHIDSLSI